MIVKINNCSMDIHEIVRQGHDAVKVGSATVIRANECFINKLQGDRQHVTEDDYFQLFTKG